MYKAVAFDYSKLNGEEKQEEKVEKKHFLFSKFVGFGVDFEINLVSIKDLENASNSLKRSASEVDSMPPPSAKISRTQGQKNG